MTKCILWTKSCYKDGYPAVYFNKKMERAHRVVYAQSHDLDLKDIRGKLVCHTCDTPKCVNPDHLFLGTVEDNVRDMHKKNRAACRKFNKEDYAKCCTLYKELKNYTEVGRRMGMCQRTVIMIVRGLHVTEPAK